MENEEDKKNDRTVAEAAQDPDSKYTRKHILIFLIPALIGALIFFVPYPDPWAPDVITIGLSILVEAFERVLGELLFIAATVFITFSAAFTLYSVAFKPSFVTESEYLNKVFVVGPVWYISRLVGAIFYNMWYFQIGPEEIIGMATGGTPAELLIPTIMLFFLICGPTIVLLTDFGLMEFIGTLLRPIVRPLFTIPGRSTIDAMASWFAASTVGVVVTRNQYTDGFYSGREAAVIATNFSLVSIGYIALMAEVVGLPGLYFQLLFSTWIVSLVIAMILPRVWPLSKITEEYYGGVDRLEETTPEQFGVVRWAIRSALERAKRSDWKKVFTGGAKTIGTIYFSLLPLVMAWATLILMVAELTPVFDYLSYPFGLLFDVMGMPSAYEVGNAFVLSFPDQFLGALIGAGLENPVASFMCAGISITGLIYITEVGVIIVDSEIPLDIKDVTIIYFQRAILTAFLLTPFAYYFAG